jgi:hypothetical protein
MTSFWVSARRAWLSATLLILENRIQHYRVSSLTLRIGNAAGFELLEPSSEIISVKAKYAIAPALSEVLE